MPSRMRLTKTYVFLHYFSKFMVFCYVYFLASENDKWVFLVSKSHGQSLSVNLTQTSKRHSPWMISDHVNSCVSYPFIEPIRCHLGSMAVWSRRIFCGTSAYADAKRLHHFGRFNAFLDMFTVWNHLFQIF